MDATGGGVGGAALRNKVAPFHVSLKKPGTVAEGRLSRQRRGQVERPSDGARPGLVGT